MGSIGPKSKASPSSHPLSEPALMGPAQPAPVNSSHAYGWTSRLVLFNCCLILLVLPVLLLFSWTSVKWSPCWVLCVSLPLTGSLRTALGADDCSSSVTGEETKAPRLIKHAQTVKHLSTMRETGVRALDWEDPLEKEMVTHSSILAWRNPWTEEPGGLQSTGRKESDMTELLHFHCHFQSLREPQTWDSPGLFHCGSCAASVSHHLWLSESKDYVPHVLHLWGVHFAEEPLSVRLAGPLRYSHQGTHMHSAWGFPGGASGKEPTCQCRRHKSRGFDPWVRKIPLEKKMTTTPVFLPGESHGQRGRVGYSP